MHPSSTSVAVLCGGVGAARFLNGLLEVVEHERVTAIVNVGDDTELHGLSISPDIDTITYTLAKAIDPDRGWGLAGETWVSLGALEKYEPVRPTGSTAATRWFGLGDQDLATHLYRTQRRVEGARLSTITREIARAWGLSLDLLPATDDRLRTFVTSPEVGRLSFQEFFVRHRHAVEVDTVEFEGAETAVACAEALAALQKADLVVIAPSNPLVSIGPIRAIAGYDELLRRRRKDVIAISPIVGGRAIKGPADHMLARAGHDVSVVGIARLYREVISTLVIDRVDAHFAPAVAEAGVRPVVTETIMATPEVASALATTVLDQAVSLRDIDVP